MITYVDYGSYYEVGSGLNVCRMNKIAPQNPMSGSPYTWEQYVNQQVAQGRAALVQLTQDPDRLDAYWKQVRSKRDILLAESDWTQSRDVNLSDNQQWVNYRQQLRNIPQTYASDPRLIVWPTKPTG